MAALLELLDSPARAVVWQNSAPHRDAEEKAVVIPFVSAGEGVCPQPRSEPRADALAANPGRTGMAIDGVVGLVEFPLGWKLVVITAMTKVGEYFGDSVYSINEVKAVPIENASPAGGRAKSEEARKAEATLLNELTQIMTTGMYTSNRGDILLRASEIGHRKPRTRDQFIFNRNMLHGALWETDSPVARLCMQGYFGAARIEIQALPCPVTLVSRRCRHRSGTRFRRRGIDAQGQVANMVETEQLVDVVGVLASFVQIRGSIPLFWTQRPEWSDYRPPPVLHRNALASRAALARHMALLAAEYGGVLCANLVRQRGSEWTVGGEYERHVAGLDNGVRVVSFDVHHHCGHRDFDQLFSLVAAASAQMAAFGFYARGLQGETTRSQTGVVRTNCIDCLDRTNLAQSYFARAHLLQLLQSLDRITAPGQLNHAMLLPLLGLWAENGDMISRQYSGTRALKRVPTRPTPRVFSALTDGHTSLKRFFRNTFADHDTQTCLDLLTGETDETQRDPEEENPDTRAAQGAQMAAEMAQLVRNGGVEESDDEEEEKPLDPATPAPAPAPAPGPEAEGEGESPPSSPSPTPSRKISLDAPALVAAAPENVIDAWPMVRDDSHGRSDCVLVLSTSAAHLCYVDLASMSLVEHCRIAFDRIVNVTYGRLASTDGKGPVALRFTLQPVDDAGAQPSWCTLRPLETTRPDLIDNVAIALLQVLPPERVRQLPVLPLTAVVKAGFAFKLGSVVKNWKRRHICLHTDGVLSYARNASDGPAQWCGTIDVHACSAAREWGAVAGLVSWPPLAAGRGLALPTLGGRTYYLYFESESEYSGWLLALRAMASAPAKT